MITFGFPQMPVVRRDELRHGVGIGRNTKKLQRGGREGNE